MTGFWIAAGGWWAHAAVAGGAVLLLGWAGAKAVTAPARRHRIGVWSVRGAVLAAGLCLLPAWLVLPVPEWPRPLSQPTPVTASARVVPPPFLDPPFVGPVLTDPAGPPRMVMAQPAADPRRPPTRFDLDWRLVDPFDRPLVTDTPMAICAEPEVAPVEPVPVTPAPPAPVPAAVPPTDAGVWERVYPLLLIAYFGIAGVLLLQLLLGHLVLVRLAWRAAPLTGKGRWVLDRLTESTGAAGVRAVASDAVPSPVCFGFVRPTVLLPKRLAEGVGEDELRWVLAHELDHVQRGDHRTAYWVAVARAVFFFVPWFWPLRKEIGLNQEFLADAAAAGAGGRPVDYAAFLVNLSGTPLERRLARPSLASTGVRAGKSDLFRRVTMVLKWGSSLDRRVPRGFAAAAGAGVLATAVGLSGIGFASEPPKKADVGPTEVEVRVEVEAELQLPPPEPPAAPEPPTPAMKPEAVKALKAKIEKAIQAGRAEEARELLNELEKSIAPPAPPKLPAAPKPPVPPKPPAVVVEPVRPVPGVPAVPAVPGVRVMRVQPPQGDWVAPHGEPFVVGGQNQWVQGPGPDLRKQYDKQLKDFDKAIQDAKDADAREQLTKARDEYKKAMEEAVAKADAAKADLDKARKELNRAAEQNRLQLDMGQRQLLEMQQRLQDRLMKDLPEEFKKFGQLGQLGEMRAFEFPGGAFGGGVFDGGQFQPFGVARAGGQPRFGARVDKIPPAMIEQLNLEKDAGILIVDVVPGTVADNLKLKKNDILLRFAGKDIPSDPESFVTMVGNVKGGQKIDVTVLRKGKKETFKDVELPEAKEARPAERGFGGRPLGGLGGGLAIGGDGFEQLSIQISNDDVTVSAGKDGVKYGVTGKMDGGKLTADQITVTEGKDTKTYEGVDKVPEKHREAVTKLLGKFRGTR